jgi:ABC-type antimicrobial peptide transport system permease subunit
MDRLEFLQGTLETLILRTLLFGPRHGYAIAQHIRQTSDDALTVALIGIYGVVAYNAAQRRFEMGLRAALGARPRDILGLMTTAGLRPIVWGLVVGPAGAAACGRLLRGLLFGVSPLDAVTMVSVALVLGAAGAWACYLPVRAVSRVDPATVLRYE